MKKKILSSLVVLFLLAMGLPLFAAESENTFSGPIGLQLYSIRHIFKDDLEKGMAMTRDWGIQYVEITTIVRKALPPEKLLPLFEKYNLKGVIAHFPYNEWKDDPAKVAQQAKALQLQYAGTASIPTKGKLTEEKCTEVVNVFNKAAAELDKVGIKFVFHNHGAEFVPWKDGTLFDRIIQETDPNRVFFELDVLWCILPGESPVRLFNKYPTRFVSCHLKDYKGSNHSAIVGSGEIDFPRILKAAKKTSIKYYFLEDESKQPVEQIPQSLRYLRGLKLTD